MKILLVEDDPLIHDLIAKQLQILGYEVTAFESAEDALKAYRETFYALVILDLGLPGMNGFELCRRLRSFAWGRQSLILVITARKALEDVQDALNAGADDYLMKPIDRTTLKVRLMVFEQHILARAQQHRFQDLIDQARDMILIADIDSAEILDVNTTICTRMGFTREELLERRFIQVLRGIPDLFSWKQFILTLRKKDEKPIQDNVICKDGTNIPIENHSTIAMHNGKEYLISVIQDRYLS